MSTDLIVYCNLLYIDTLYIDGITHQEVECLLLRSWIVHNLLSSPCHMSLSTLEMLITYLQREYLIERMPWCLSTLVYLEVCILFKLHLYTQRTSFNRLKSCFSDREWYYYQENVSVCFICNSVRVSSSRW